MNKYIDIKNIVIRTKRLILREWQLSDLDDFYEYAKVDGVGQMAGWFPHKNKDESLQILQMFITERKCFAIEFNNKVIGSIGIEFYRETEVPEFDNLSGRSLGFVLSKDYWGNGLIPEAVIGVCDYLFTKENLDIIFCSHFTDNLQSKRVQEKCGFKFYKKYSHKTRFGTIKEVCLNILKKENFKK